MTTFVVDHVETTELEAALITRNIAAAKDQAAKNHLDHCDGCPTCLVADSYRVWYHNMTPRNKIMLDMTLDYLAMVKEA